MIPKPVRDSSEKERLAANPADDAITLPAEVIDDFPVPVGHLPTIGDMVP